MVAIIRFTEEEESHFRFWSEDAEHLDRGWVAVRPAQQWKGAHIALLISSGHQERAAITFLARAAGRQRAGTFDRQIEVTRLRLVDPPLPLAELAQQLPSRHRTILDPNGILPKRGGEVLLKTLTTVRPGLQEAVDELRQIVQRIRLVGSAGELFAQERDATGLALQIAGYDRGVIGQTSWLSQSAGRVSVPFLDTIEEGAPVIEDQLLNYDAELFAGLLAQRTNHLAWKAFRDEKSLLIIGNVNRFDPEHTLGVDLIYYNMTRQSFVLVQYKKMVVADRDWSYYPASDKRLDEELDRMRLVDDICEKVHQSGDDYRLSVTPCWIKLCKGLAPCQKGTACALGCTSPGRTSSNCALARRPKAREVGCGSVTRPFRGTWKPPTSPSSSRTGGSAAPELEADSSSNK